MSGSTSRLSLINTPSNEENLEKRILKELNNVQPRVIGLAVAYVSVYGANFVRRVASRTSVKEIRLVSDIRDAITHPMALEIGLKEAWKIRTVRSRIGTFHPKLMVCGDTFKADGEIESPRWMMVGSGNLSRGGLVNNVETSLIRTTDLPSRKTGTVYRDLWNLGLDLTSAGLAEYADYFAARNKSRPPEDLNTLGVSDDPVEEDTQDLSQKKSPTPGQQSIPVTAASAAWAGLQSFTGEYTLQVEFPRDAGIVLQRMIAGAGTETHVNLKCGDGVTRSMHYAFYEDNSMFRLNVPNEVPGVQWARENKDGIAYVDLDLAGGGLSFRVVLPGAALTQIVRRSIALGTWGKTPTRLYGWF